MWLVHIGTVLSAYFILAANSFMQNPVGFRFNPATGRAEMDDFLAVLTNKVQLVTFPHVLASAYMVGGALVMGVALWLLRKHSDTADAGMYRRATRFGAVFALVASLGVIVTGDIQGKIMTEVQPMKMAAAEGLYETTSSAPFSVLSIGTLDGSEATRIIEIPGLLSFLATGTWDGTVEGIDDLQVNRARDGHAGRRAVRTRRGGPGDGRQLRADHPAHLLVVPLHDGPGLPDDALRRRGPCGRCARVPPQGRWWTWVAVMTPLLPVFANSWGWIFTEVGRQPWIVYGS